jgi:dTMP kinase
MERGKFISIEGIEGVGKSTNIDALVEHIEAAGHKVLTTREPGGTPFAEDIRDILMNRSDEPVPEIAELLLMFAARSFNVNSSRAYQGGGRGLPMETIDQIADWVHGDTWPDLTILLDAPVEIGMERAGTRSAPDRIEQERHDFFERVRECYLQIALREPERFVVIDTTRSIDEVRADIAMLAEQILYLPSL